MSVAGVKQKSDSAEVKLHVNVKRGMASQWTSLFLHSFFYSLFKITVRSFFC